MQLIYSDIEGKASRVETLGLVHLLMLIAFVLTVPNSSIERTLLTKLILVNIFAFSLLDKMGIGEVC